MTDLLKELHKIENDAIRAKMLAVTNWIKLFDLSQINLEKLRDEFSRKVRLKLRHFRIFGSLLNKSWS